MYCPDCGKQNEEDAKFCAHCGADMSSAADAQPAQAAPVVPVVPVPPVEPVAPLEPATPAAPTAIPPQPAATVAPTPVAPTPAAAPAPPPEQPAAAPVSQPAAPPPAGTVPAAPAGSGGEPAKKGSSKCWFVGCGIILVLAILGGVGTCVYGVKKGGEAAQNLQQEIQGEIESSGLVIDEGGDDNDGGSSSTDYSGSDDAAVSDAPAAAVSAVELMFAAWVRGDVDGVKSRMTTELADENGDELFSAGYKQESFEFTGGEAVSSTEWAFTVEEEFRNFADDETQSETYRLRVVEQDSGWKVSAINIVGDD